MGDRYSDHQDSYSDNQYGYGQNGYGQYGYGEYGSDERRYAGDRGDYRRQAASSRRQSGANPYEDPYMADPQRSARSYSRDSGAYRSTGSSSAAGAYANGYGQENQARRLSQGDGAGRSAARERAAYSAGDSRRRSANAPQSANLFDDHFSDETVETYRRSAYGSNGSGASRYSRSPRRSPMEAADGAVVPAQQGGRRSSHARTAEDAGYAPKRSNRKRVAIIAAVIVLAVVLVGAGAAWAYVNNISNNLHKNVDQETLDALEPANQTATPTALAETPFYMLLMGADVGGWRAGDERYAGDQYGRSDSMILTRVDPVNKKVALISIHRDTMVDLGQYGQQKINAAYELYGPAGAIKAVSTMAGVPISHFAVVDFGGFSSIVDALGGVEVNVPMEINDDVIGAHISAGQQTLNGEQALDLCRSRHSYDDVADDGDVMRAANQRMVIGAIAKKILSSDLMTIANSVQTLSQYVSTDLELSDIIGLAQIFKGMDPAKDMYTAMEPTTSAYIDETWYEYLDEAAWKEMISRMDQGLPPVNKTEIDDRTGTVLSTGGADAPVV